MVCSDDTLDSAHKIKSICEALALCEMRQRIAKNRDYKAKQHIEYHNSIAVSTHNLTYHSEMLLGN